MLYFFNNDHVTVIFSDGNIGHLARTEEVESYCKDNLESKLETLWNMYSTLIKKESEVKVDENKVTLNGVEIHKGEDPITDFVILLKERGFTDDKEIDRIIPFIKNMIHNPFIDAPTEIYDFCKAGDFEITDDGCILAYKNVRKDLGSIYDNGATKHEIGKETKVDVLDCNRNNLCSNGLHFCSKSYLSCYPGDVTIVVKVNPIDIISIPTDYNYAKGRCRKYLTVGILDKDLKTTAVKAGEKVVKRKSKKLTMEEAIKKLKVKCPELYKYYNLHIIKKKSLQFVANCYRIGNLAILDQYILMAKEVLKNYMDGNYDDNN